ncbi:rhomboid family intramembrane serine protease [Rubripirellula reticaptiva]|uniref:Rhomboid family protein n=1 Tax=Rubripirellula reticaptiva TaxID=2528013 RepID=A0A5C6EBZ0_9BACT|nr:rhomboid family intramembrane serine protease [Rubripirellula reticaptiva]TWU46408.1 Rhomboid family protein [Rubripirellula reticaptiva]
MPRIVVHQTDSHRQCRELRLVMEAAGIASDVVQRNGTWFLSVDDANQASAVYEIEAYQRDNAAVVARPNQRTRLYSGGVLGVFAFAVIINAITFVGWTPPYDQIMDRVGPMRAGDVMGGDGWRVVTALTLHVDLQHWLSNLIFGGVFGWLVGRVLGGGVGWLVILLAGSLGNLINAWARDAGHVSIGSSTAVFGALGIMVAHALAPLTRTSGSRMKRFAPLVGGVLMFAMLGVEGERTDVGAHAAGFFAGLLLGAVACRAPERWLANWQVQWIAGVSAVLIIGIAWLAAVSHA